MHSFLPTERANQKSISRYKTSTSDLKHRSYRYFGDYIYYMKSLIGLS